GGSDHLLRVHDAQSTQTLLTLDGHDGRITEVAYRPDGRQIVSCALDRTLIVWDATTGKRAARLVGHVDAVMDVAWAPDGRRIVTAGQDRAVHVWDSRAPADAPLLGHDYVTGVSLSPDGKRLASAGKDQTILIRRLDGRDVKVLRGHRSEVLCLAFDPSGRRVVSGSDDR